MAGSGEMFWRKFESMIAAGVAPNEVADNLAEEHQGTMLGTVLAEVAEEVAAGGDLRAAIAARRGSFPDGGTAESSPVSPKFSELLQAAVAARASDVHVEPHAGGSRVRFRVDGQLREESSLKPAEHRALVESVKRSSALDPTERELPQDGRIRMAVGADEASAVPVDIRVSVGPSAEGESVVMRILHQREVIGVEEVLDPLIRAAVMAAVKRPYGLFLVTGPTGSGKTTTQIALFASQLAETVKGISVEDPVVMEIPGAQQIQVRPWKGLTYPAALKYALRSDPDILSCDEIRDEETASILVRAAVTGHLVFVCMHANSAVEAIGRLLDLGMEPHLLADSLIGAVGQRLVRKIDRAKVEPAPPEDIERLREILGSGNEDNWEVNRGVGHAFRGRTAVQEYLEVTPRIRRLIYARASRDELLAAAREEGFRDLQQNGALRVARGQVALSELLRACPSG